MMDEIKENYTLDLYSEITELSAQNAALLDMLNNLARWVGKGIADGAYSECANPERAMVDLNRATEAIRNSEGRVA